MEQIALVLIVLLHGITIYTDLKWNKIKIIVTIPAFLIALGLMLWAIDIKTNLIYLLCTFFFGILPEKLRTWSPGDSKLFIASSLLSAVLLNSANPLFVVFYLGINMIIYLFAGHAFTFYKSGFKPLAYLVNLKAGGEIGRMPGALPIAISNVIAIVIFVL
ncbi:hypothetical protein [Desulfitobacterium chlororespirans]|uniref:Prepilin type IV endopeptidase peptidase domain-containing protein n=1 Tax=Desulfitobacterium chlororespirans DSM 11544 TaxID=1121395 RepID=A0A1M7T6K1_9FIRM|nr:hypothetical protein [Desulfitobacterium chlororespirans]SHN66315.1 hypothetical protein SAMN02745215_01653 [Desulfitobacterium chlororespirans DSM 11544]